jgi:hypothetical protein
MSLCDRKRTVPYQVICPNGKSLMADLPVCPAPLRKIFRFSEYPTQAYTCSHPVPNKRGVAHVTNAGTGCGGRGCAFDEWRGPRTAKSCGPDTPTLVSNPQVFLRRTVANKPGTPGRARRKPLKPFACGNAGMSRWTCGDYARVVCFYPTRGCGCIVRPAFPTPFVFRGEEFEAQPGRNRVAGRRGCVSPVRCHKYTRHART